MEVNYIARKKFKANGKMYEPGDVWEPQGGKHDDAVIRHLVTIQPVEEKPKRTTRRKKTSGTSSK